MKVSFQVIADGKDITDKIKDRLISIDITDEAGGKSDKAVIEIDDRDNLVEMPPTGATLRIALGFEGELTEMGQFVVDDLGGDLFPASMKIEAKAADMIQGIRARRTRSWEKVTLRDIVSKIAGEHGLKPAVGDSVKSAFFEYLAQTSESDLNFLTRLARDLDAVAKPAGGALVVVKRGEGKSASGRTLPVHDIYLDEIDTGTWSITSRGKYGRVVAEWGERGSATLHKVTVGDQEPELTLRHPYATKAEAERAAQSALDRSERASGTMSINLGGFDPGLMAEAKVNFADIKAELRGEWLIKKVSHRLGDTLTTSIDVERGKKKKAKSK